MKIFNVGNKSINLYLIDSGTHRLLIDAGFPAQLNELGRAMRQTGYTISAIDFLLVTHFHIDHAGAVQELKDAGVQFMLIDIQIDCIKPMEKLALNKWQYTALNQHDNIVLSAKDAGIFLQQYNFPAQVIETPGHSSDSVSLVLDTGETFTGDLLAEHLIMEEISPEKDAWEKLKRAGAKTIYPGHGKLYKTG
jgi:ribonuclease/clavin/mitogillin